MNEQEKFLQELVLKQQATIDRLVKLLSGEEGSQEESVGGEQQYLSVRKPQ